MYTSDVLQAMEEGLDNYLPKAKPEVVDNWNDELKRMQGTVKGIDLYKPTKYPCTWDDNDYLMVSETDDYITMTVVEDRGMSGEIASIVLDRDAIKALMEQLGRKVK